MRLKVGMLKILVSAEERRFLEKQSCVLGWLVGLPGCRGVVGRVVRLEGVLLSGALPLPLPESRGRTAVRAVSVLLRLSSFSPAGRNLITSLNWKKVNHVVIRRINPKPFLKKKTALLILAYRYVCVYVCVCVHVCVSEMEETGERTQTQKKKKKIYIYTQRRTMSHPNLQPISVYYQQKPKKSRCIKHLAEELKTVTYATPPM